MPDFHKTIGQDVLEEPAEKLHDVEVGGAWACTAGFTVGEGDGTVFQAHDTAVGDSDPEDIRGKGLEGRVSVVIGLTVHVPGDGPDLGVDVLQQSSYAHLLFPNGTIDGGESFDGDKEVGSGGQPCRAVRGETTARDDVVDVGVVLELPAPGRQDTEKTREVRPDETLVCGEPFQGQRRGGKHGVVREALMRADEGSECLRNGEGEEEVRPGQLCVQVVLEPLLGCMLLALRTVPVATGMRDAVLRATALALIQAVAIVPALALLDSADGLALRSGQMGITLQVLWRKGRADIAEGRHGRSPCMRALRRS
jgi:hypothetical protein